MVSFAELCDVDSDVSLIFHKLKKIRNAVVHVNGLLFDWSHVTRITTIHKAGT